MNSPAEVNIEWLIDVSDERKQGIAAIPSLGNLPLAVLLIKTPTHWCGYVESPKGTIPTVEERVLIESYTKPFPTFYGPSGPVISWTPGLAAGNLANTEYYWIGFDLQSAANKSTEFAEQMLKLFVWTLYRGFLS